jgi:hypothetical protein
MNIFSYSIKKSDREELEQELGKRLTDVEYNSIVNSVNSIKDNLNKIDLASILSPTETEAPIKCKFKINDKVKITNNRSDYSDFPKVKKNSYYGNDGYELMNYLFKDTPGKIVHVEDPSIYNGNTCLYHIKLDDSDLYAVEVPEDILITNSEVGSQNSSQKSSFGSLSRESSFGSLSRESSFGSQSRGSSFGSLSRESSFGSQSTGSSSPIKCKFKINDKVIITKNRSDYSDFPKVKKNSYYDNDGYELMKYRFKDTPGKIVHVEDPSIHNTCLYHIKLDDSNFYEVEVPEDILITNSGVGSQNSSTTKSNAGGQTIKLPFNTKLSNSGAETDDKLYPSFTIGLNTKDVLNNPKSVINRSSVIDKRSQNNNKYVSQTSEMEQKYLKYKNKYLSLKQKIEN